MITDMRARLGHMKGYGQGDIDALVGCVACIWAFDQDARVSKEEDRCIQVDSIMFLDSERHIP